MAIRTTTPGNSVPCFMLREEEVKKWRKESIRCKWISGKVEDEPRSTEIKSGGRWKKWQKVDWQKRGNLIM